MRTHENVPGKRQFRMIRVSAFSLLHGLRSLLAPLFAAFLTAVSAADVLNECVTMLAGLTLGTNGL